MILYFLIKEIISLAFYEALAAEAQTTFSLIGMSNYTQIASAKLPSAFMDEKPGTEGNNRYRSY